MRVDRWSCASGSFACLRAIVETEIDRIFFGPRQPHYDQLRRVRAQRSAIAKKRERQAEPSAIFMFGWRPPPFAVMTVSCCQSISER